MHDLVIVDCDNEMQFEYTTLINTYLMVLCRIYLFIVCVELDSMEITKS